jgi:hypothetical protein
MHVHKFHVREPGGLEVGCALAKRVDSPVGEGKSRTTHVYDLEESDSAVVPMKSPNKARGLGGGSAAEVMEGRVGAKENCE